MTLAKFFISAFQIGKYLWRSLADLLPTRGPSQSVNMPECSGNPNLFIGCTFNGAFPPTAPPPQAPKYKSSPSKKGRITSGKRKRLRPPD